MPKTSKPDQLRDAPASVLAAYNRLNSKQKAFALALPTAASQAEAAHLAGYAASTASKLAFKTAALPDVKTVAGYLSQATAKEEVTEAKCGVERQIAELLRIGLADPRTLFNEHGNLLPIHEWPEDIARAVSSIESFEEYQGRGEDREAIGMVRKVKFHGKIEAIDKIARIRGHYRPEKHEHRHSGLSDILEEIDGADTGPGPSS